MNKRSYIKEKKCRLCFETNLKTLINLGKQPLANRLKNNLTSKEIKLSLQLCFCKNCKTVQIKETVDPKLLFKKYFWQTSTSTAAKKFSDIFCSKMLSFLRCKKPFIVEIASNDGTFLVPFKKKGYEVLGVDPAKNLANESLKNEIPILNNFFNEKTAKKIVNLKKKPADLVFARNVIAHVKNIHEIADAVYSVLSEKGIFAVEFHYAKEILNGLQYDSIYHEHLFYFNLETIKNFFLKKNFYLYHAFRSPISGGSIVALFSKKSLDLSNDLKNFLLNEKKDKSNLFSTWKKFAKEIKLHRISTLKKLENFLDKDKKIIAYGASARSSTFLNYCGLNNKIIDYIVDKNPLKLHKYTPGSNLKIISLKEFKVRLTKFNVLLLLAWNFKDEIIKDLKDIGFKGVILSPFPKKVNVKKI
jgi:2-polyprenyl-3-methyl-5-hydroxy-6-metoxy-1,4-benzoquinol methylase